MSWIHIVGSKGSQCCEVDEGLTWQEFILAQMIRVLGTWFNFKLAHIVLILGLLEGVSIVQKVFFIWWKVLWEISLGFEALILGQVV